LLSIFIGACADKPNGRAQTRTDQGQNCRYFVPLFASRIEAVPPAEGFTQQKPGCRLFFLE
jgi:hypothetical protein